MDFEATATGYKATDAQVQWWQERESCPGCGTVCSPAETINGVRYYHHRCTEPGFPPDDVYWTRPVPISQR